MELTSRQNEAVECNDQNLRIIACAGSGKTSTIAEKVSYLLDPVNKMGIEPKNIIAFTYTEKAAAELKHKILKLIKENVNLTGLKGLADMYIGTIHGWCLKALQENEYMYQKFTVLNDIKLRLFVDKNYKKIGMTDITKIKDPAVAMKIFVDTGRFIQLMNIIRESDTTGPLPDHIQAAKEKYESCLKSTYYFDFTMIMTETVAKLEEKEELYNKIRADLKYLIVDEYQDINPIQERLIETLYETAHPILTVVGDDDQNIYQWRGSNNQFIKQFTSKYAPAREVKLEMNFRSSKGITSLAESVIERNDRLPKVMYSAERQFFVKNEDVLFNVFDGIEEENEFMAKTILNLYGTAFRDGDVERGLDYSDFAILLRTWGKTESICQTLQQHNIPFITAGVNNLFNVAEAKAAAGIFEFLSKEFEASALKKLWLNDIPYSKIDEGKLDKAIGYLTTKFPEDQLDGKGKPIWAYNLQDIFWNFLAKAEITEECFDHRIQSEIIMYNLGKFSQVLNDFEQINFNSAPPPFHLFNFCNFLRYAAKDYYPEGWIDNPYRMPQAVQIMTVHQAKGLEFPAVFIPGLNKNYLPAKRPGGLNEWHFLDASLIKNQDRYIGGVQDERRLFYVALTRAQKYLFVSRAPDASNQLYRKQSEFVPELSESSVIVSNIPDFTALPRIIPQAKDEVISMTLNFSVLKDFFECPYRFKIVSMYGFCYPLDQRMGMGRSLHNSLMEIHKRSKLGQPLSSDQAAEIAQEQSNFPYLGKSPELAKMKDIVKDKVKEYFEKNEPMMGKIEYVEQEIQLNLDDSILVTGKIDLIKRNLYDGKFETTIIEFKSNQDVQNQKTTEQQLNLYAVGHLELTGEKADYIQIYDLDENQESIRKVLRADHIEETKKQINEAATIIRLQQFSRVDSEPICKDCFQNRVCSAGIKYLKKKG
jgi:DNA helicase II / ATP-dependent DNA helicase PcrA